MYFNILFLHSWMRWVVLISLLVMLIQAIRGWICKKTYTRMDNKTSIVLVASTHIQVLLGLWLYFFLSPLTRIASTQVMQNPVLRYWKMEHFGMMIVFLILVQTGRIVSKKKSKDVLKHKVNAIFGILALIVLVVGMPWPKTDYERPLFRSSASNSSSMYMSGEKT